MPDRPLRLFLCHSSGDKPAVRDLYRRLKGDGFAPWLDEEELLPGQDWQQEIPAAVRACDVVIIFLSQRSVGKEGYLQREIRDALYVAEEKPEGTIFIIPVKLEEVEVPKRLSQWQWANLFQEGGYQRLVRALNLRASAIDVTVAAHGARETVEAKGPASVEPTEGEARLPPAAPQPAVSNPQPLREPKLVPPPPPKSPGMPSKNGKGTRFLAVTLIGVGVVVIVAAIAWVYRMKNQNPRAGTVRENPKDGLKYVWIPPDSFMMGCSHDDNDCQDNEKPPHQVTISKGFWIGQTEVTVGAYKRFAGATGRQMPPEPDIGGRLLNPGWGDDVMPIVDVTWDDAQAYCGWAGGKLPTEAEWEYAARGGSTAARYGDLNEIAWYADNSGRERLDSARIWKEDQANYEKRLNENGNGMHEVGQKRANKFGLHDVLGNVWEWVNDWYDQSYYQKISSIDPKGPLDGEYRVLRGGSWFYFIPKDVRVSFRLVNLPGVRGNGDLGFRCGGEVFAP